MHPTGLRPQDSAGARARLARLVSTYDQEVILGNSLHLSVTQFLHLPNVTNISQLL